MTETQLMERIRALIRWQKLSAFHAYDSRRSWGRGFPDVLVVGRGGILFREVKSATGTTTGDQDWWGWLLTEAGADYAIWRPADLESGRIQQELAGIR